MGEYYVKRLNWEKSFILGKYSGFVIKSHLLRISDEHWKRAVL